MIHATTRHTAVFVYVASQLLVCGYLSLLRLYLIRQRTIYHSLRGSANTERGSGAHKFNSAAERLSGNVLLRNPNTEEADIPSVTEQCTCKW